MHEPRDHNDEGIKKKSNRKHHDVIERQKQNAIALLAFMKWLRTTYL